ncbi:hypothetical protein H1R20_g10841, partial [Candolleomyces eurysporus]
MRTNFISTGFLVLAVMAFQVSAAPVIFTVRQLSLEPNPNVRRSMQGDISDLKMRELEFLERNLEEDLLPRARLLGEMNSGKSHDLHPSDLRLSGRDLQGLLELDERDLEDLEGRFVILPMLAKWGPTAIRAAQAVYKKVRGQ